MGNYFKALQETPKATLNRHLWYNVVCFALLGAARGVDEGLIGSTASLKSFSGQFGLTDPRLSERAKADKLSNITSMVQLTSIGGALIAFVISDRFGRIWATRFLCLLWITGTIVFITAETYGQVLAGRAIMGMGVGQTTVVAPVYLAEIAPRTVRGLCVTCFSGAVYLGIMLGYFAVFGASLHIADTSPAQWRVPTSLHAIFAGIIFLMSWTAIESPRYLCKKERFDEAETTLSKLRGLPKEDQYIQAELADIRDQLERERSETQGSSAISLMKELVATPANRYRLMLGIGSQLLGQWSGAGSVTLYAVQLFSLLGITGSSEQLLATAVFGIVKLVAALVCAFFLVDFLGRKRSLSIGIILQAISMGYIAIYLTAHPSIATSARGMSASARHAGTGAIVFIYVSGIGWAVGWNTIQYLLNAEIYPLRIRAFASSLTMTFHFANQYGNTKALPYMLLTDSLNPRGTFWFFFAVTLAGLLWVAVFVPETAGRSLEVISFRAIFRSNTYSHSTVAGSACDFGLLTTDQPKQIVLDAICQFRYLFIPDLKKISGQQLQTAIQPVMEALPLNSTDKQIMPTKKTLEKNKLAKLWDHLMSQDTLEQPSMRLLYIRAQPDVVLRETARNLADLQAKANSETAALEDLGAALSGTLVRLSTHLTTLNTLQEQAYHKLPGSSPSFSYDRTRTSISGGISTVRTLFYEQILMFFSTAGVWQVIERMARGCLFQALVQKMMNEALDATWTGIFLEILKPVTEVASELSKMLGIQKQHMPALLKNGEALKTERP
ncbi:MAG: hypothetical protein CYPHOPRED_004175 [Cyphobasidiales sp. Tagirdzhanova-0007]|nr:MAG: hypothetical protein CYPHOPRED_004175 [Cyphobasidiales sp. Tagirdzhanova-0007]